MPFILHNPAVAFYAAANGRPSVCPGKPPALSPTGPPGAKVTELKTAILRGIPFNGTAVP